MSFKFAKGAASVRAFSRLPELLSDDPAVQAKIGEMIRAVAFKEDLLFRNQFDVLEAYKDHSGDVAKVNSRETGVVFGSVGAGTGDVPRVKAIAANQSIANNTTVTISWDSAVYDSASMHGATTITIPEAGKYVIYGGFYFSSLLPGGGAGGKAVLTLVKNPGTVTVQQTNDNIGASMTAAACGWSFEATYDCASGDTFNLDILQLTGSSQTLTQADFNALKVDD